jgi:hypothetical protein
VRNDSPDVFPNVFELPVADLVNVETS